jgi:hypothetical protein
MKLKLEQLELKSFVTAIGKIKGGTCTDNTQSGETVCGQECTCYEVNPTNHTLCTTPAVCEYTYGEGVCGPH